MTWINGDTRARTSWRAMNFKKFCTDMHVRGFLRDCSTGLPAISRAPKIKPQGHAHFLRIVDDGEDRHCTLHYLSCCFVALLLGIVTLGLP